MGNRAEGNYQQEKKKQVEESKASRVDEQLKEMKLKLDRVMEVLKGEGPLSGGRTRDEDQTPL